MQESLASRVCSGDNGLATSNIQQEAYEQLTEYGLEGPVVFMLCFFVSTMSIIQDVHSAIEASKSVLRLRGDRTIIKRSTEIEIVSISTIRVFCFLGVQLCRFIIAFWLWYGGIFFLGSTVNIPDLMLNTGAANVCYMVCTAALKGQCS